MIKGGNATIYVSDLNKAVRFYTETLGLALQDRFGDEWASIDAGNGLILGLQPTSGHGPSAGRSGSICVGFNVTERLENVIAHLASRGVQFRGPIQGDAHAPLRISFFADLDGNELYLCEISHNG